MSFKWSPAHSIYLFSRHDNNLQEVMVRIVKMCVMCSAQFTLHTLHLVLHSIHHSIYSVHCALYTTHYVVSLHSMYCSLCSVYCTMRTTVLNVQYALDSLYLGLCSVQCTKIMCSEHCPVMRNACRHY